jgi:site-specific recombinase XerD
MTRLDLLKDIPKLPKQDKYLLDLQNNAYSSKTIINYARDLAIFSVFLHFNNIKFGNLTKEDISNYKGYLTSGNHLKDLDKIREEFLGNGLGKGENNTDALRGARRPLEEISGMNTPRKNIGNEDTDRQELTSLYKDEFLTQVYSKVYGSLGILEKPLNSRSRSSGGLSTRSINRMLSALRSYLKFRIEWDLDIPIPPDGIKMVKGEKKVKKVASLEELVKLIEAPMEFEKDERVALRNRCMLEMLFATGVRISELISLDIEQVNKEGKIYVLGKGKKERVVFMTPRSLGWLNKYLKLRLEYAFSDRQKHGQPGNSDKLFSDLGVNGEDMKHRETSEEVDKRNSISKGLNLEVFDSGNRKYINLVENYRKNDFLRKFNSPALFIPFVGSNSKKDNCRLSINYFQEKITDYRKRLGIQIPTSAHSLRHGFATYMAEQGASPVALQILLGHESLDTTTRYVHASEKFAEETVRKSHPLK